MTGPSTPPEATHGPGERHTPIVWKPEDFAARCREIIETKRGHEAHRALDLLTNDVLASLGFGEGVRIFEAAVAKWHADGDPYPYPASCPDCE